MELDTHYSPTTGFSEENRRVQNLPIDFTDRRRTAIDDPTDDAPVHDFPVIEDDRYAENANAPSKEPEEKTEPLNKVQPSLLELLINESDGRLYPYMPVDIAGEGTESKKQKYECYSTDNPEEIAEARRLVASRYLGLGFIKAEEIGPDGTLTPEADPYATHATYYLLRDAQTGDLVATSRRIHYDDDAGEKSFPLWDHKDELDPEYVNRIKEIGIENAVEISALVRSPAYKPDREITMNLYRKMFQDAWAGGEDGEKVFLMACKPRLFDNFKVLFDGSMKQIGPELDYPGEVAIPAMFELGEGSVNLINKAGESILINLHRPIHRKVVKYMLKGADKSTLDPAIIQALQENGFNSVLKRMSGSGDEAAETEHLTIRERLSKRKPEIIGGILLAGYTAARTAGVAGIESTTPGSGLSWEEFLAIELGTTPTYVWGVGDTIRSMVNPDRYNTRQRLTAGLFAGGSLLAPYVYVAAEGQGMPTSAWEGVAGAFAVGVAMAVSGIRKRIRDARMAKQPAEMVQGAVPKLAEEQ